MLLPGALVAVPLWRFLDHRGGGAHEGVDVGSAALDRRETTTSRRRGGSR
jgi:hypothetical protein